MEIPMKFLSKLFTRKDVDKKHFEPSPPIRHVATVELKSPQLLAFDLTCEGVRYEIPNFTPGRYTIPLEAIVQADKAGQSPGEECIEVDTGSIYFIDADFEENFRTCEAQVFEETGDSFVIAEYPDQFKERVGITFDCLIAPGLGSEYDFVGDGSYILDISKIQKA